MIPSFIVFEGLLKPRDVKGRKERATEIIRKKYPNRKVFDNTIPRTISIELHDRGMYQPPMHMYDELDTLLILHIFYYVDRHKSAEKDGNYVIEITWNVNDTYDCTITKPVDLAGDPTNIRYYKEGLSMDKLCDFIVNSITKGK